MEKKEESREFYRRKIIEMVGRINNDKFLRSIYVFVSTLLE